MINQLRICPSVGFLRTFAVVAFVVSSIPRQTIAQTYKLPAAGQSVRIEAECFSAVSSNGPVVESCRKCSAQANLGCFSKDSWFEIEVDAPQMLNFSVSLQAASLRGTEVEVLAVDQDSQTPLTTIRAYRTRSWRRYRGTRNKVITLPAGVRRLRFKNLLRDAKVDYIKFTTCPSTDVVSRKPTQNDGPDINPLKGFNSGWWRNEDHASVGFQYIEWGKFEPQDDQFDWDYVEEVLNRPGTNGRHFILQFVCDWDYNTPVEKNYLGPAWLLDLVGERQGTADPDDPASRPVRATNYDSPIFIAEAGEAIKALLDRYRDDHRTFIIQVGVLGFWAEWHTFPRVDWTPAVKTKQDVLAAYLSNLGTGGLTQVRFPNEPVNEASKRFGMGYTNGSVVLTEHGREFGAAIAERELWKNGPVGGEWPPNVFDKTLWERFFADAEGLDFILEGRYSTILPPEIDAPNHTLDIVGMVKDFDPEGQFMTMHRAMGYNFQVKDVRYLVSRDSSGMTHIEVDLHNVGIAPFYKNWDVQLAVLNSETGEVVEQLRADVDLRSLGPNSSTTLVGSTKVQLAADEKYEIGIRILQPHADQQKTDPWKLRARNAYIQLANDIKVIDGQWAGDNSLQGGWNILSEIQLP